MAHKSSQLDSASFPDPNTLPPQLCPLICPRSGHTIHCLLPGTHLARMPLHSVICLRCLPPQHTLLYYDSCSESDPLSSSFLLFLPLQPCSHSSLREHSLQHPLPASLCLCQTPHWLSFTSLSTVSTCPHAGAINPGVTSAPCPGDL